MSKIRSVVRLLRAGIATASGRAFPHRAPPDFAALRVQSRVDADLASYLHGVDGASAPPPNPTPPSQIWCTVCASERDARFGGPLDWREQGTCSGCGLAARQRFCTTWLAGLAAGIADRPRIYVTEQASRTYYQLRRMHAGTVGSEYVGDARRARSLQRAIDYHCGGPWRARLQHQDLTALALPDRHFDVVGSFDVLEHIPDYQRAIGELFRVTRPGGWLVLTVPFLDRSIDTLVRARVAPTGAVEHLCPPEYHGEPVDDDGCLCFYHFGWDLLDRLRDTGFVEVGYVHCRAAELGFAGRVGAFVARRPSD